MRKSFLLKEYDTLKIPGTFNMKNLKTYFGSQLIDIEDVIRVDDRQFIWSENTKQEQLGINEVSNSLNLYDIKNTYQSISILNQQSNSDKVEFPVWVIQIDIASVLIKYLWAQLKTSRTFENIEIKNVKNNNIDLSIIDYINYNIFNRYKLKEVLLFIKEEQLNNTFLAYTPVNNWRICWNVNTRYTDLELQQGLLQRNFEIISTPGVDMIELRYRQPKSAKKFTFQYHYDLVFERI